MLAKTCVGSTVSANGVEIPNKIANYLMLFEFLAYNLRVIYASSYSKHLCCYIIY